MKSEAPPHRAGTKPAGAQAETSGVTRQKKNPPPPIVAESRLKRVDEVKLCSTEQRKKNLAEMHQRTQRLYEQLDEVKHQKALKSRQEDYAKNRLKAKEFHKKTLQKLHAKQTRL
ncbi:centrosomal protein of 295 kDa-like isoform X2 [Parambassis ranga]|uniref:Centrosomal protein of 295 kDa-like isoform X2 n=1 Tax=Parambassis ranga TaxID=210632 RepID=A0A6P7JED7_9TELE|nr:centrosomal protein of 295 kDa-like isoform X2 [Parambassis ranga]